MFNKAQSGVELPRSLVRLANLQRHFSHMWFFCDQMARHAICQPLSPEWCRNSYLHNLHFINHT